MKDEELSDEKQEGLRKEPMGKATTSPEHHHQHQRHVSATERVSCSKEKRKEEGKSGWREWQNGSKDKLIRQTKTKREQDKKKQKGY